MNEVAVETLGTSSVKVVGTWDSPIFPSEEFGRLLGIPRAKIISIVRGFENDEVVGKKEDGLLTLMGAVKMVFQVKHSKPEAREWMLGLVKKYRSPPEKSIVIYDPNDFKNESCVYLLKLSDTVCKFGQTEDMPRRMTEHTTHFAKYNVVPSVIKIWKCSDSKQMKKVETSIKSYAKAENMKIIDYGITELVNIEKNGLVNFVEVIDKYVSFGKIKTIKEDSVPKLDFMECKLQLAECEKKLLVLQKEYAELLAKSKESELQLIKTKQELQIKILETDRVKEEYQRNIQCLQKKNPQEPVAALPAPNRAVCNVCKKEFAKSYLKTHLYKAHDIK